MYAIVCLMFLSNLIKRTATRGIGEDLDEHAHNRIRESMKIIRQTTEDIKTPYEQIRKALDEIAEIKTTLYEGERLTIDFKLFPFHQNAFQIELGEAETILNYALLGYVTAHQFDEGDKIG